MPNRAAILRAKIEAQHPGSAVRERHRHSVVFDLPDGKRRLVSSVGLLHDRHGREIDTDLDDDTGGWVAKARAALDFDVRISEGGYRYYPRDDVTTEWIEFGRPLYLPAGGNPSNPSHWQQVPLSNRQRVGNQIFWDAGPHQLGFKVLPHGIKVGYRLTSADGNLPLAWPVELVGLSRQGGEVWSNADSVPVMWLTPPRWEDATGITEGPISWDFVQVAGQTYVRYDPPDLSGAVFPVMIDPSAQSSPTAGADDGRYDSFSNSANPVFGKSGDGRDSYEAWFRFPNVAASGTVSAAYIELVRVGNGSGTAQPTIYAIDEDDHTAPNNATQYAADPLTSNSTNWSFSTSSSGTHQTPDLTDEVQEVFDRPGWSSGNAMGFHFEHGSANPGVNQQWDDYEGTTPAELNITYSSAISVTLSSLDASATIHAPTVHHTLTLPSYSAAPTVHAPTLHLNVVLPAVDASATIHAPTVHHTLTLPAFDASPTIHAPTLHLNVELEIFDAAPTIHEPELSVVGVTLPALDASPTIHAPTVHHTLTLPAFDAAPTVHAPALHLNVVLPAFDASPTIHTAEATFGIVLPSYSAAPTIHAPTLHLNVVLPAVDAAPTIHTAEATFGIVLPAVDAAPTVHAPALHLNVTLPAIDAAPTVHAPTLHVNVVLPAVDAAPTVHAPTLHLNITLPSYSAAPTIHAPAVHLNVTLPAIDASATIPITANIGWQPVTLATVAAAPTIHTIMLTGGAGYADRPTHDFDLNHRATETFELLHRTGA